MGHSAFACLALSASLLAASSGARSQSPEQLSFYGLRLGEPLSVPECPKKLDPFTKRTGYDLIGSPAARCFAWSIVPPGVTDIQAGAVRYPFAEAPRLLNGGVGFTLLDGNIHAFDASTHGQISQQSMMSELVAKYGPPTKSSVTPVTNQYGAVFDNISAAWDISDSLQVQFIGMVGRTDEGLILVGTRRGIQAYMARQAALNKRFQGQRM